MTDANRQSGENEERIIEIEIERLRPFKEHPFQVKDDKEMFLLQESIEKYRILKSADRTDRYRMATMKSYPVTEENMLQRNLDTVKYR